ncbi:MAG: hypothetical protein IKT98_00905 [Selenomonadaceae bacterium]|nr:hypothetical protein [Selenomonadaceae bacterium]
MKEPNDIYLHKDGLAIKFLKEGLEDKPTLTVDDNNKILQEFLLVEE